MGTCQLLLHATSAINHACNTCITFQQIRNSCYRHSPLSVNDGNNCNFIYTYKHDKNTCTCRYTYTACSQSHRSKHGGTHSTQEFSQVNQCQAQEFELIDQKWDARLLYSTFYYQAMLTALTPGIPLYHRYHRLEGLLAMRISKEVQIRSTDKNLTSPIPNYASNVNLLTLELYICSLFIRFPLIGCKQTNFQPLISMVWLRRHT